MSFNELKENKDKNEIFAVNIVNFSGIRGESISQHKHSRIYKNNKQIKFIRSVHEQLESKNKQYIIGLSPLLIYHSGYLTKTIKEKKKSQRNTHLIENELNEKNSEGFDLFNLGNEYRMVGKFDQAIDSYIEAYKRKEGFWQDWIPFCLCNLVECLYTRERYEDALKVVNDAERIYDKAADFTYLKGHIYLAQGRFEDAREVFELIISNPYKYTGLIKEHRL